MSHAKRPKKTSDSSAPPSASRGGRRPALVQRAQAPGDAGLMDAAAPPMRLSDASTGDGAPEGAVPEGAVQPKVTVGAPGDRYEREADAVAQRVTQGQPAPPISALASGGLRAAQRQEDDEEPVQRQAEDEADEVQRQTDATDEDVQRRGDDGTGDEDDLPVQPQSSGDAPGAAGAAPEDDDPVQPASDPSGASGGSGGSGGRSSSLHARAATAIRARDAGQPLPRSLRRSVEPLFGRDFSGVRVHTGTDAQEAAQSIHAHAFTHRNHIWLGARASTTDASLMTHELTHVVQQGHAPPLRSSGGAAATRGVQRAPDETDAPVQAAAEPVRDDETVQRFDIWGAVKDVGSSVVSGVTAVGQGIADVAGDLMDMGREALMGVVRNVAPDFARLIERDGLVGLLKDVVKDGFDALFGGVFDAITSAFDFEAISEGISGAVSAVQGAAASLVEGSATAIVDAARSVSSLIGDALTPVINTVRDVASTVREVFSGIMSVVGTPVLGFIERIGGSVWRAFKGIVDDVGAIFSTVKDALGSAWSRVKGFFGITADEGTDEGGGIWEWVKDKASNVWSSITGALEPAMGPLREVGSLLLMLSPAGPALALYENWPRLKEAFAWIQSQWSDLNIIVRARAFLRDQLLPTVKSFLLSVGEGVQQAANWLADNVSGVASQVDAVLGALGGSALLGPLRSVIQFVKSQFSRAASFVQTVIRGAGTAVRSLFQRLVAWIDPLLGVLRDLVAAAVNPFGIIGLLAGSFWLALPNAIKGVIIDFILDLLRGFVRAIPGLPQLGLLWPFIKAGMLGFLDRMRAFATERKVAVSNKIATIISGGSFAFAMGYLRGLATGIWEAVTGPFYAIAMLFDLPSMIQNFVSMLGNLFTGIADEVREIIQLVAERADETLDSVLSAARELLENPGMLIDIISGAIQAALDAVSGLGAAFADRLMSIFEQPDEQLGLSLGTLTGNLLVEALLAVFTAGVGNAAAGVGRVANLLRRVQRNLQRVLRMVADLMRPVLNFVDRIIDLFRGAMTRVGEVFQRIGSGFNRIVDRFRNLFQRLRGRRRGTPDAPDAPDAPGRPRPRGDTTPDVDRPATRPRGDGTPDSRPRTDTTPDQRPRRDRDADDRRRRDRDDDEESYAEKQARLLRVVARLRPQIRLLLNDGISEHALDARLRVWRGQYRLSRLYVRHQGNRFEIIARINPSETAGRGYEPRGQELRALIHEAVEELLDDPQVQAAARRHEEGLESQSGGSLDQPLEVSQEGLPGLVRHARREGGDVGPDRDRYYQFGSDRRQRVSEEGASGTNAFVRLHPSDYEGIRDTIASIKRERGLSDSDIALALRTLVQTGEVPQGLRAQQGRGLTASHRGKLSKIAFLIFGREAIRNPSTLATAPMMLELIAQGESDFDRMFTSRHDYGGGAFPPSFEGASTAAGQLEDRGGQQYGQAGSRAHRRRRLLMLREMRIARLWLQQRMAAQDLHFENRREAKEYVVDALREFYIRGSGSNE